MLALLQKTTPGFFCTCPLLTAPLWQKFFMMIMRTETDLSTPKRSQRQELILRSWKHIPPSGSQRTGEEFHTPRGWPSFAYHQINKKVSNFTADYSRPGNSKISFTANSAGNPGGQVRKQRAAGVGESMAVNKNQYFTCYQENKVCNSGSKQLACYPAERTRL